MAEIISTNKYSENENVIVHCTMFVVLIATIKRLIKAHPITFVSVTVESPGAEYASLYSFKYFRVLFQERVGLTSIIVLVLGITDNFKILFCRAVRNLGHSSKKWLTVSFVPHKQRSVSDTWL